MRVGVSTDVGRVRQSNEDAYWISPPWFVVADGMGGHAAGEVASRVAIENIKEAATQSDPTESFIRTAMHRANQAIWQRSQTDSALTGMGTTLTIAVVVDNRYLIGHVGDSRCYVLRGTRLIQLTRDHSVVAELIRTGTLTENEATGHPQSNLLTRALGMGPNVEPDIITEPIWPGDKLLLCTDGLTAVLSHDELSRILSEDADPDDLAKRLVRKANERGGPDNITAVVSDSLS